MRKYVLTTAIGLLMGSQSFAGLSHTKYKQVLCKGDSGQVYFDISEDYKDGTIVDIREYGNATIQITDATQIQNAKANNLIKETGYDPTAFYASIGIDIKDVPDRINILTAPISSDSVAKISSHHLGGGKIDYASTLPLTPDISKLGAVFEDLIAPENRARINIQVTAQSAQQLSIKFLNVEPQVIRCVATKLIPNPYLIGNDGPEFVEVCDKSVEVSPQTVTLMQTIPLTLESCNLTGK